VFKSKFSEKSYTIPKEDEVSEQFRVLSIEKLHDLYSVSNVVRIVKYRRLHGQDL
jgi:hypothetical protein